MAGKDIVDLVKIFFEKQQENEEAQAMMNDETENVPGETGESTQSIKIWQ